MHACDRRTDRPTDRQTDRILIARPRLHCMQRGKNEFVGGQYRITPFLFPQKHLGQEVIESHASVILYLPWMYANRRNFRVPEEIGVEEHDGDVRFKSGSGNMAFLCMRNAFDHTYRNSSVIVDLAMGQIPRSTERISSLPHSYLSLYCYQPRSGVVMFSVSVSVCNMTTFKSLDVERFNLRRYLQAIRVKFVHYQNSKIPLHKVIFLIFSHVWFNCLVDLV